MEKPKTINQHFVPQFYLENFLDDNRKIHVYDLKEKKYFHTVPKKICYHKYLYEMKKDYDSGEYLSPNCIENIYTEYDGRSATVLRKILNVCKQPQNRDALILRGKERKLFFCFVAHTILRNPWSMDDLSVDKITQDDIIHDETSPVHDILSLAQILSLSPEMLFLAGKKKMMLSGELENDPFNKLVESLKTMHFFFVYAEKGEFLTSDVPVCMGEVPVIEGEDKTSVYFALSPKIAVIFGNYQILRPHRNRMVYIDSKGVDVFNRNLIKLDNGRRLIIGASEELVTKYISS